MKVIFFTLIFIGTFLTAANGQTPADSGKWPWKPFFISLSAVFEENTIRDGYNQTNGYTIFQDDTTYLGSLGAEISVDTVTSIVGNTLSYDNNYVSAGIPSTSQLSVTFVPGSDSIASLTYSYSSIDNAGVFASENSYSFEFSGLRYDSSTIVFPDSSLSHASFSLTYDEGLEFVYQLHTRSISVTSISVSGLFKSTTLTSLAEVSVFHQGSKKSLQSYPNPFTQSATISFTSGEGDADISVVNLLGVEVAHLYSGELAAGNHSFTWEPNCAVPGMYECIVRTKGAVEMLPMMMSK